MKFTESLTKVALVLSLFASTMTLQADVPRTPSGKPDLSGTYDTATLTPLERPEFLGDAQNSGRHPEFWAALRILGDVWLSGSLSQSLPDLPIPTNVFFSD